MAKNPNSPLVMLDSNVIISGITSPRYCFEILNHAFHQDFKLTLPEIILQEVSRNVQKKFPVYLHNLEEFFLHCPIKLVPSPQKAEIAKNKGMVRDKNDIPVILSAVKAGVDFLVTGDKDFTEGKEMNKIKKHFAILNPDEFLRTVMRWTDKDLEKIRLRTWSDLK